MPQRSLDLTFELIALAFDGIEIIVSEIAPHCHLTFPVSDVNAKVRADFLHTEHIRSLPKLLSYRHRETC